MYNVCFNWGKKIFFEPHVLLSTPIFCWLPLARLRAISWSLNYFQIVLPQIYCCQDQILKTIYFVCTFGDMVHFFLAA